jgi:hypothetical protein
VKAVKNTRRQFSMLGFGSALFGGARMGFAKESASPILINEHPRLSSFEVNLAGGLGSDIVATFARSTPGREAGEILFTKSANGGNSWTRPVSLFRGTEPHQGHQLAAITRLSSGALVAASTRFEFLFAGKVRWRRGSETSGVYLRTSTDGGSHWTSTQKIDTGAFRSVWTRGSIVEMPDGTLLLPLAGQKGERYAAANEPIESFVLRSKDGGRSWEFHSTVARDSAGTIDYDEPSMVSLGGRRLLCVLRAHESPRQDPPGGYLHTAISEDGGATWSAVSKTSMWGHPANLLRLRDGRILCTYGYRMHPNPGVRGCVSEDGAQWKPEKIFAIKEVANLESNQLQIGCPSSVELSDGKILTAYHLWGQSETAPQRQFIEGRVHRV